MGKLVQTVFEKKKFEEGRNTETVNLTNLAAGAYVYVLQNKRGKTVASGRFVVVK